MKRNMSEVSAAVQVSLNNGSETTQPKILTSSQEGFLQSIIDASASKIAILDENRKIIYVNRAWRKFAVLTDPQDEKHGIGSKYPECCSVVAGASQSLNTVIEGINKIIESDKNEFQLKFNYDGIDGEDFWFLVHAAAFRHPALSQSLAIMVSQDRLPSTEIAPDALRNNKEFLTNFFATTKIFPWESHPERRLFTYVGNNAAPLLGYTPEEWLEPDFWISHIHPEDLKRASAEYSDQLKNADQFQFEYRMLAKDGRIVWIHDMVNVQRENSRPVATHGFMIDVAEQNPSEDMLRLLSGRLITAQEEERKRIARELHDDLNQRVALVSIELEQVGQKLQGNTDVAAERVKGIQKKIEEISTDIHRMSYQLHPSKLDHLGLAAALKSFCRELSESRELTINFRDEGVPVDLPKDIKLCIFRIGQEALQNAVKHSGASNVKVRLKKSGGTIKLIVSDNGCGFDPSSEKLTKGLGFISMKERLHLVNGDLRITSGSTQGTRIEASIPL